MEIDLTKNQTGTITGETFQSCNTACIPDEIKVYPLMGLKAMLNRVGGAWRIWVLSRAMDIKGTGRIVEGDLQSACNQAGIHPKTYNRWLKQAIGLGILTLKTRASTHTDVLLINNITDTAFILGCDRIDKYAVYMESNYLINGDWRGKCWEAYIQVNHNEKIISRKALEKITGIPRHQQARLENETNVVNKPNVVFTDLSADHVNGFKDNGRPTAYEYKGKVAFRIPDQRGVTNGQKIAKRGCSKKINSRLQTLTGMSLTSGEALSSPSEPIKRRLFFKDEKKMRRALKYYMKKDIPVEEVFLLHPKPFKGCSSDIWERKQIDSNMGLC